MRTKIYLISDGPWSGTGFGEELKQIAYRLAQSGKYDVLWQSLQHFGRPVDIPDVVFPDLPQKGATVKILGNLGLPNEFGSYIFPKHYDKYNPDLVMFMGDPRNIKTWAKLKRKMGFAFVFYVTLDGLPIPPHWIETIASVNMLVAMTEWAQIEWMKTGLGAAYIYHGINWNYWDVNDGDRQKLRRKYGISDDTVIYLSRDVNQHRKRQDALLKCWKAFNPESKNAKLLLWTDWSSQLGINLENKIAQYKVPRNTILSPVDLTGYPKFLGCPNTVEEELMMAKLGDVYLSTTSGEGFGKCLLEAISLKQPVIATKCSSIPEVVGKGGILIPPYEGEAGKYAISDNTRSVDCVAVNQEKFVEAMLRLYQDKEERKELGLLGREHAKQFDYDTGIIPAWLKLLGSINPDDILIKETLQL